MIAMSKVLDNKLKIIYAQNDSNPLVSLQLFVRIGSSWEDKDEAGFSHFMEHLVFKSTPKFPQNSVMEYITNLGGHFNAYTEYDSTCFYITLPSKFLKEGIDILAQLTQFANFSEAEFNFEKQVVIEELKEYQNNPEESFMDQITESYFSINPYKFPIVGNISTLKSAKISDLQKFYKKYYFPENCYFVVTGDIVENVLISEMKKCFGDWENQKKIERKKTFADFPKMPAIQSFKKKISHDMLAFVLPDLSDANPKAYHLSLATKAFAIGKNSRLHQRLFNDEKIIDSVRVHTYSGINDGATMILIMSKKGANLTKIIEIFQEELEQFYRHGLRHIELTEQKQELIHFHRYSFEYMESLASNLGSEELATDFQEFFAYPEKIKNLSNAEITKVINKYFDPKILQIYHCGKQKLDETNILTKMNEKNIILPKTNLQKDVFQTTLENGMKIIFKRVKGKPTVGVSISYNVSQLNETMGNRGVNLLTGGMLIYGNEKRDYKQFLNFCTTNGIHFGVNAESETTSIRAKCFNEMLPTTLDLMAEVVLKPTFPQEHLHNLQLTYKSNLDRVKDYPEYFAGKLWKQMIFGKNSNLINKVGNKTSIGKITVKQLRSWHQKYYHPENMAISIVGDFDFSEALFMCEKNFVFPKNGFVKSNQNPIFQPSEKHFIKKSIGSDQAIINIGGFACKGSDLKKNTAFYLLSQILGGDTDSILFNELREKRGLAYSVLFDFNSIHTLGVWNAMAVVDKKNESRTVDLIMQIFEDIKNNGILEKKLEITKNYIRGQRLFENESVLNLAHNLSILETMGYGYKYFQNREKRLNEVNIDFLHKLAKEYLKDSYTHILS
ncbi:MAG: insulinase family protein [Candidatus Cloacimonetes bacterium]|jgi:zinc protease|nr:insulinase family protein [Candidatus Cloacimonadota bacterium]MBT7469049.1 insulinase family protein [Candidatus Cloacimonadota bacterium]